MRRLNLIAAVAAPLLVAATAQGGVATATYIGISSSTVSSGHESEATDAYTSYYYDLRTDGFIWRDSSVQEQGSQTASNYSSVFLSTSASAGHDYTSQTNHWVVAYFSSGSDWNDFAGYSLVSPGGYQGSGGVTPPFTQQYPSAQSYYIASGYISDNTYAPQISGINVIGSPAPGGSGYIEVYGSNLSKWAGATTSNVSGNGVSTTTHWSDYTNPNQVNLAFSITSGASPGNRNLTVTTPWGTSNNFNFTVNP
jgi:hypothetical protein